MSFRQAFGAPLMSSVTSAVSAFSIGSVRLKPTTSAEKDRVVFPESVNTSWKLRKVRYRMSAMA